MTAEEFISIIHQFVYMSAVSGTLSLLEKPPGRKPPKNVVTVSKWFAGLSENDKEMLRLAMAMAAHHATFGVLAVLDGVQVIEDSRVKGTLELYYVKGDERTLLNAPKGEFLHDLFNGHEMPY
jgi:hypothetical protein